MANPNNPFSVIGLVQKFTIAFAKAGGTPDLLNNLSQDRRKMRELVALVSPADARLTDQLCLSGNTTCQMFDPGLCFREDSPLKIKFSKIGPVFERQFLAESQGYLRHEIWSSLFKLRMVASDEEFARAHADFKLETTLAHIWALISLEPSDRDLPRDGRFSIFYVRDPKENLWTVRLYWKGYDDGWDIEAMHYNTQDWPPETVIVTNGSRSR